MTAQTTEPAGGAPGLPVRTLQVEVVDGPDAGEGSKAPSEHLTVGTAEGNDLVLSDPTVSRYHLELVRGEGGIEVVDHGSTNGTVHQGVRIERAVVRPGTVLTLGRTSIRVGDGGRVTVELHEEDEWAGLRGRTPVMRRLMARVRRAAQSDSAVLLVGESGTGKELIARALHDEGPRRDGPFGVVDCGALSPSLEARELFGPERGAFTGADRRHEGAFERANGGTLLLDEVGELPAALQPALLGALERRRFRRVGGRDEIDVDVRLVCATHRDLRTEVNAGTFRLDLYYRIAVVVLAVPALRERAEDVPLLVEHFVREAGVDGPLEDVVSPDAMAALCAHHWPGNVRELRNVVEAMMVMGEEPTLDGGVESPDAGADAIERSLALSYRDARAAVLAEFERRYLRRLLDRAGGNVSRAAREARMDRTYLIKLLARHHIQ